MDRKPFLLAFLIIAACGNPPGPGNDAGPGVDAFVPHMDAGPDNDTYVAPDTGPIGCTADIQCDDHVDCTTDTCVTTSSSCRHVVTPALCAAGESCNPATGCAMGHACASDADCADTDACTTMERCDHVASVCTFVPLDNDHDGDPPRVCGGHDCDDSSSGVNSSATEVCDSIDNNCDGHVDEGFDLTSNDANCGSCGHACPVGSSCSSSSCTCSDARELCTVPGGLYCADTSNDSRHCGMCNHRCPFVVAPATHGCTYDSDCEPGMACDLLTRLCGTLNPCVDSACTCPGTQTLCGGGCFDTSTDVNHCGDCITSCSSSQLCVSGHCVCPSGQTDCGGTCFDTTSDVYNCGGCGIRCDGGSCISGACHWDTCPSSAIVCGGVSTCPFYDPLNCGSCGHTCASGHCVRSLCS